MQNRYAADTYWMENYGLRYNAINPYFHDGRFVMTAFLYILSFLPISMYKVKLISFGIAFISLFISEIIIYNIISRYKNNKIINIISSIMLVLSIFVVELFYFTEYTAVTAFSILLITISTKLLLNYFQNKEKKNLIIAFLCSTITAFCYQGTISLLVIFPIIFTLKYSNNIKKFIKNNIIIAINYSLPSITTLVVSKIVGATRVGGEIVIKDTIIKIVEGTKNLFVTSALIIPSYVFLVIFIILTVILIYIMYKKQCTLKYYLFLIYTILATIIVPVVPYLVVNTSSIWIVPRSTIGIGLLVALPVLFYVIYIKESTKHNNIFIVISSVFLVVQLIGWNMIGTDQIKNNTLEMYETENIARKIADYEKSNNRTINKLVTYKDQNVVYSYPGITTTGDMNYRNLTVSWSFKPSLSMHLNRNLKDGKENNQIKKYCSENNWDRLDDDQFKFEDDTLYLCIY